MYIQRQRYLLASTSLRQRVARKAGWPLAACGNDPQLPSNSPYTMYHSDEFAFNFTMLLYHVPK